MFQRIESRGGQNTGLTQAAAGHFAPAYRLLNKGFAAAQQRAYRCAQPFRQANGEGVAILHDLFQRHIQRDCGVEDARPVDMQCQLVFTAELPGLLQVRQR